MVKRAARVDVSWLEPWPWRRRPRTRQIVDRVRAAIARGVIGRGARLPASRELAATLGVSRNTIIAAYEELTAEGLVCGLVGAGSYVARGVRRRAAVDCEGTPLLFSQSPARR